LQQSTLRTAPQARAHIRRIQDQVPEGPAGRAQLRLHTLQNEERQRQTSQAMPETRSSRRSPVQNFQQQFSFLILIQLAHNQWQ